MKAFVVDTNVLIVANNDGRAPQAGPSCVEACVNALEDLERSHTIVLDDLRLILAEYEDYFVPNGQPGAGSVFLKWVWQNQGNPKCCETVEIHPRGEDDYEEFPDDPELAAFDRSDRKFVAVALASERRPSILNAVDSDWWEYRSRLKKHGVIVKFLCPGQFGDAAKPMRGEG